MTSNGVMWIPVTDHTAAPEAALRGAAAGCRPVRARRTQSGLHDGWRILWRPRKAAALKLRRRQGRESRPRCRIEGECFIVWPPARRHPGRPTAASAAGGEMHPAPSVWRALAEGLMWAERPDLLQGFPVRHPGSMGTNTTRIWSRVSSPEAARPKGAPIHHSAWGWGLDVRRVVLCAGSIPAGRKYAKGVHTDGIFPGNV